MSKREPDENGYTEPWLVRFMWRLGWFFSVASAAYLALFVVAVTYTNIPFTEKFSDGSSHTVGGGRGWGDLGGMAFLVCVIFAILATLSFVGWYFLRENAAEFRAKYAEKVVMDAAKAVFTDDAEYQRFKERSGEVDKEVRRRVKRMDPWR